MVVNFRSYINREIFCCFFAEQASLANTRVYNYKNEIKMALHCLSTSGVSGTKKMHILRTEFALISILPRKGKRIARFREEVYSWRDVKTGLDIIEKYSFFWKIGGQRTLPSQKKNGPVNNRPKKNNNNFFWAKFLGDSFLGFLSNLIRDFHIASPESRLLTRTFPRTLSSRTYKEWCRNGHGYNQVASVVFNDTFICIFIYNEISIKAFPQSLLLAIMFLWPAKPAKMRLET